MDLQRPSLRAENSRLIRLFAQRTGVDEDCADTSLRNLLTRLVNCSGTKGCPRDLHALLQRRRISGIIPAPGISSDGYIEPIGRSFEEGFRIVLKAEAPTTRARFTIAHEICHTFFYEIVPEIKFIPHEPDPAEERLCNIGASELLMPARNVKNLASRNLYGLRSLEQLANAFGVSMEAMLLRLRSLRLCDYEMTVWKPTTSKFVLERITGGRKLMWRWLDETPLKQAWNCNGIVSGRAYIECTDESGAPVARPVAFELSRRGDSLLALWTANHKSLNRSNLPLFASPRIRK